jgi:hypothetical protein
MKFKTRLAAIALVLASGGATAFISSGSAGAQQVQINTQYPFTVNGCTWYQEYGNIYGAGYASLALDETDCDVGYVAVTVVADGGGYETPGPTTAVPGGGWAQSSVPYSSVFAAQLEVYSTDGGINDESTSDWSVF